MSGRKIMAVAAAALLVWAGAGRPQPAPATVDAVTYWNRIATDATVAVEMDPLAESRLFAILHLAIHDALNAIDRRYETYAAAVPAGAGATAEAAVAAAAHAVLTELFPAAKPTFDAAYAEALRPLRNDEAKKRGLSVGSKAAAAMLALRRNDGASRTVERAAGTQPGEYRPTPPDYTPAKFAQWPGITPFVLKSAAQFRPAPPPVVDSEVALADIAEVKAIGAQVSATRSEEQSEIARFWYENSTQGWNRISREIAMSRKLSLWESARFFALVNLAMADGFIGGFEAKYHYYYWRPATAIRAAGDSTWESYLWTPPVPDYPSTHTVLGAAAATVMARFYETDFVSFQSASGVPYPGLTRKFWSFSEAARENGASRVLAGIHFTSAVNAGYVQGEQIGAWVFAHALRPVRTAPSRAGATTSLQ